VRLTRSGGAGSCYRTLPGFNTGWGIERSLQIAEPPKASIHDRSLTMRRPTAASCPACWRSGYRTPSRYKRRITG